MLSHIQPCQPFNERVMGATSALAFRHKITMRQELRAILLQKPLNRRCTGLMWPDVDVTDALCHSLCFWKSSMGTEDLTVADRTAQSKRDVSLGLQLPLVEPVALKSIEC